MGWLTRNWKYIAAALAIAGWGIHAVEAIRSGKPVPVPPVIDVAQQQPAGGDAPRPMGWVDDQEQVQRIAAALPIRAFRFTPAFDAMGQEPDHAYLWEAARKVRGSHIPTRDQGQVGSCVPHGAACAVEYVECVQAATDFQKSFIFRDIATEPIYGGSRVQIGGGQLRGEDGSTGAWAAKWCNQYGVVPRGKYGSIDLTTYSESRCRQYGDAGCPAALVPVAKEKPVKSITQVTTTEELRKSLANGYAVTVASNVGFGPTGGNVRDANGFLKARGSWPHQMCFIGYAKVNGQWGYYCMNSWGTAWVSGPTGPGDPPPGGFWIHESTAARMLAANDSWAYANLVGFLPQKLDWNIRAVPARPNLFALINEEKPCFALSP